MANHLVCDWRKTRGVLARKLGCAAGFRRRARSARAGALAMAARAHRRSRRSQRRRRCGADRRDRLAAAHRGPRDEMRFMACSGVSQVESLLWYRRYPRLSVAAIERNAAIRSDLARFSRNAFRVPEAELDAFLRRF